MSNKKMNKIMEKLNLTENELLNISLFIETVAYDGKKETEGGMYTRKIYITPNTCYTLANAIKKINEYLYDNPTFYKKTYDKLMECAKNK